MSLLAQTSTQQLVTSSITAVTAQFQTLSTQTFNVSSINGIVPGAAFSGSTTALSTGSVYASNVVVKKNGNLTSNVYGPGFDALSIQSPNAGLTGGIASLYFGASNANYPLARIGAIDQGSAYANSALVFQTATPNANSSLSGSTVYNYTGADQTYTVPAGVTSISVYLWGAGGGTGNWSSQGTIYFISGGAGAMVQGTLAVTPGQVLTIGVGQGGSSNLSATYGGGGSHIRNDGASGGGRSFIALSGNDLVTAGGGGGAGFNSGSQTGPNGIAAVILGTTNLRPTQPTNCVAGSGTQSAGGQGGTGDYTAGNAGTQYAGGSAPGYGGGGGGGYWGGGGGSADNNVGAGGGGGGSSYIANLASPQTYVSPNQSAMGAGATAPNTASPYYTGSVGVGGNLASNSGAGGNGLIVISVSAPYNLAETMRISKDGNLGVGTSTPTTLLDVAGAGRFQSISTLSLQTSTINGLAVPTQFVGSTNYISAALVQTQYLSTYNMTAALASFNSVSTNSLQSPFVSTQAMNVSSINGIIPGAAFSGSTIGLSAATINVSTLNSVYFSSVQGYVSSLRTDSLTVGGPSGYVTIQDLTTGTVSTGQVVAGAGFISSLQINTLSFGPSGYVIVSNFIANTLSTTKLNAQSMYTNNAFVGNVSSQSAILFPGVDGNYRGTAVAEQTTGAGTGELLLYKVSSTTDQIRLQTTGNIVFEAGAAARSWPSTTQLATPTLYIAGTTSNVGIGTAAPAATLDVVGTGRFQLISSYALNVSSINGAAPGGTFNGSTLALSTAIITTSTLATNALTTSSITSYGTVDLQGNVLSNVGTEYFIKPLYTTTFLPTNISGLKAWFDASKPASITSNGSGQVFTWSNLAGFANATQAVASNTPVTGQLSINSLNTVQFNPTNEITFGPISYTTATRAVFAVLVTPFNPSVTNKGTYIFGGQDATLGTAGFHGYQFAASGFEFQTSIGGGSGVGYVTYTALSNAGAFSATNAWLLSYHPGNGIFVNGTSNSTAGNLNTGSSTDLFGSIGQGFNVNTFYVAEFLQYDTTFSLAQRQTVEGYLAWKWGIQSRLNGTHPYLSIAPPPLGITFLAMGGITADTGSNISFSATNKIRLTAPVEIPTTLNTSSITVSTINGSTLTQLVSQPIQSTVQGLTQGLGTAGYISTAQLNSTVSGLTIVAANAFTGSTTSLSAGTINVSTLNTRYLSSVQGYVSSLRTDSLTVGGPTGYVTVQDLTTTTISTGQLVAGAGFISSLQINTLSFGPSGYVIVGDVIANSLSTKKLNTQALYTNNLYVGNVSSQSAILFPGIDGNYRGTAVAEQRTGLGTGELLLYKVSSTTDQIRLQTTGNIVFEAGAASRSWPSTAALATPTLYIQGSTSNVGVGTASPATTLDVAGTGRFQLISSYALNVSSINGAAPGGTFNGSTLALSTAAVKTSSLAVNVLTVGSTVLGGYAILPGTLASTWTQQTGSGTRSWFNICCSADGTVVVGCVPYDSVYISKNSGVTWTQVSALPASQLWAGVCCSSSGQIIYACAGLNNYTYQNVYRSGDGGTTWTSVQPGGLWDYIACSADGTKVLVLSGGAGNNGNGILTTDSGATWNTVAPSAGWTGIAASADGTTWLATGTDTNGSYPWYVYVSTDGGNNWNGNLSSSTYPGSTWKSVCLSSNGQICYAADDSGGYIWKSTNQGATWSSLSSSGPRTWTGVSCTADGTTVFGTVDGDYVYISVNGGTTWTAKTASGQLSWKSPVCSVDGGSFYAAAGYVFSARATYGNVFNVVANTLSTVSLDVTTINGAAPWQPLVQTSTVQGLGNVGYISSSQLTSTVRGITSNISSMIDPTELASTVRGLGTAGFISTVGLSFAVASTAQGLGTFGYTSTNQLLSTTIGVYGAIGSNITTTVQPQFASTVMGLGTVGYVSTAFTGSTTSLSAATIVVSSLATNSAKTSSLTMYGTLNMSNNLLTNVYSALFTPTYSGNPNAGAGGTYTTYTSGSITYAVHTFTVTGTTNFTPVTNIISAQVLIIGGGGSGGGPGYGGGGGAGGAVYLTNQTITSSGGPYLIVVGTGGAAVSASGYNTGGNNGLLSSAFGSAGAGGGGGGSDGSVAGKNGGCGGGAGYGASAGTGSQGYNGGSGGLTNPGGGGGGGGMGGAGANYNSASPSIGGAGIVYSIVGYNVGYAAGGGAASSGSTTAVGGSANGTIIGGSGSLNASGTAGAANTGSGGGGCGTFSPYASGAGGSGIVIIAYPLNQFGITPYTVGTITGDATSNLSIQPVNNLNIVGITQTSALLAASTFSTTFINATTVSAAALQVSTINGEAFTAATPFTGSTLSLSTASIFTSSLRASTISVGGGAWMSNDGLYLSNVQAGGAVGKLITNAGYVKLVTATAWNGGYGAFAITGGDLTPKIYMNAGQAATGAQMAIGGFNPSPGAGISLDVFGAGRFSSISTFQTITSSMGVGTAAPQALLDVAGTGRFQIVSTLGLQISSINGSVAWQQSFLTSTIDGLATSGYVSTTQLGSTVTNLITRIGAGGGGGTTFVGSTIFLSATQVLFSTQTGYNISSVQGYISSLQVDELQIGTGFGIIAFGDTNMSSISTLGIAAGLGNFQTINVSSINGAIPGTGSGGTTFTGTLGTVSSLTALRFYGLTGTYANTAVAEVSTGTGLQELLLYKVSSISDQVRVQTTGNVIFESGVSARGWPVANRIATPNFYIAASNSNVGINTSNPVTTLDVAGTGRFQTLSSLNITAGSINYSVAFV